MAATLIILLMIMVVTAVHEFGHLVAAVSRRVQGTRVAVGRGTALIRLHRRGIDFELGLIPVGGRVDFVPPPPGTSTAVIAIGGAVANVVFGFVVFWATALAYGVSAVPLGIVADSPLAYAKAATGAWLWAFPAGAAASLLHGDPSGITAATAALRYVMAAHGAPATLHALGALSIVWAALTMLPIPGLGTDGWKFLVALRSGFRQGRVEEDRA